MSVRNLQTLLAQAREHYRQAVAAQREFSHWLIHAKSRSPEEVAERCIAAFKKGEPYRDTCHTIAANYPADMLIRLQQELKDQPVMNEDTLDSRLLRAEGLVRQADRRVVNQRRLLARLERNGGDSSAARVQLTELLGKRTQYLAERDRLSRELRK